MSVEKQKEATPETVKPEVKPTTKKIKYHGHEPVRCEGMVWGIGEVKDLPLAVAEVVTTNPWFKEVR